jgi:membrane protein implicated in regulation of membrane protease activity
MGGEDFTYTEADRLAANRLHARVLDRSLKAIRALVLLWAFYAVMAIGALAITGLTPTRFALALVGSLAITLLVVAVIRTINAILLPRRSKRLFQQQKVLRHPVFGQWDANGIVFEAHSGTSRHA